MIVAGVVAFMMLGFGVDTFGNRGNRDAAITIGDKEISYNEYSRQYSLISRAYQQRFRDAYEQMKKFLKIKDETINHIVTRTLLENIVSELGLTASVKQIEGEILKSLFQGGQYDERIFRQFLRQSGLTEAQLEQELRQELANRQLATVLSDLSIPSDAELRSLFAQENRKLQFRYLALDPQDFIDHVDTSDQQKLEDYLASHSEEYREPARTSYSYVEFKPDDLLASVEVSEEDLREAYEEMKEDFLVPKRVKLRKIEYKREKKEKDAVKDLIAAADSKEQQSELTSDDIKKNAATEALAKLEQGADFS